MWSAMAKALWMELKSIGLRSRNTVFRLFLSIVSSMSFSDPQMFGRPSMYSGRFSTIHLYFSVGGGGGPPPDRPRHAASPSPAPDGRRSVLGWSILAEAFWLLTAETVLCTGGRASQICHPLESPSPLEDQGQSSARAEGEDGLDLRLGTWWKREPPFPGQGGQDQHALHPGEGFSDAVPGAASERQIGAGRTGGLRLGGPAVRVEALRVGKEL